MENNEYHLKNKHAQNPTTRNLNFQKDFMSLDIGRNGGGVMSNMNDGRRPHYNSTHDDAGPFQ